MYSVDYIIFGKPGIIGHGAATMRCQIIITSQAIEKFRQQMLEQSKLGSYGNLVLGIGILSITQVYDDETELKTQPTP